MFDLGRRRPLWWRRLAALLEIVAVFVGGTLVARLASRSLGMGAASIRALDPGVQPDFLGLSWSVGVNLVLRYGLLLGLAFLVGRWHRGRALSAYGVTAADRSLRDHVGIGVLLFATAGLIPKLLRFAQDFMPLGPGPEHWALLEAPGGAAWWLFMAVSSFALVPVVEELLFRGYVQSRLAEDFGPPGAILITAVFFTFSHTQYFIASALGVGMLASILVASIAAGYVRHRTGSVLAVIVAHALGNVPLRGIAEPVALVLMVLLTILWWRPVSRYALQLWRNVIVADVVPALVLALAVLGLVLVQVLLAPALLPWSAAVAAAAALHLELRDKRAGALPIPTSDGAHGLP